MSGPPPLPNYIHNSMSSVSSTLSTPSNEPPFSHNPMARDKRKSTGSRRRISIQSEPASSAAELPSSDSESENEDDAFVAKVKDLENLDINEADGGDSDEEGDEVELFEESYVKAMIDRAESGDVDIHVQEINNGNIAYVIAEKGVIMEEDNDLSLLVRK